MVDEDNLLKWVRSVARCVCGNKMLVKEDFVEGLAKVFVARFGQCNTSEKMCTSQGRLKRSCEAMGVETSRYDVHTNLVKATLQSCSGYPGVRELCSSFNMHPLSEKTYFAIAKQIEDRDCASKLVMHL